MVQPRHACSNVMMSTKSGMDKIAVLLFKREIMDFYDDSLLNAENVTCIDEYFMVKN